MLKRRDSPYVPGRPKGPWWKWKRDPHTIDAVLLYAQRGHGKRSGYYSDYTFGVWTDDGTLTPVGKAYFGFTDEELAQIDRWVRNNTTDRFGPVRAVRAEPGHGLVLEVAFEGLARSTRHRSGLAMRFPRIARLRWDKPPSEADTLETLAGAAPARVIAARIRATFAREGDRRCPRPTHVVGSSRWQSSPPSATGPRPPSPSLGASADPPSPTASRPPAGRPSPRSGRNERRRPLRPPGAGARPGLHTAPIRRADVDRAGSLAVTASDDKTVRVWSLADGGLLRTIRLPAGPGNIGKAYAVAISPDGATIAAGGWTRWSHAEQRAIYLFDAANGG